MSFGNILTQNRTQYARQKYFEYIFKGFETFLKIRKTISKCRFPVPNNMFEKLH